MSSSVGSFSRPDALADFLSVSRPWRNHPVPLSRRVTIALWSLAIVDAIVTVWLGAVLTDRSPCGGPLCATATLGGHPGVALVLAITCLLGWLVIAVPTRGLTCAGGAHLTFALLSSAAGLIAVAGPLMVLALFAVALSLFAVVVVAVAANA